MIADKILGNIHEQAVQGETVPVPFQWFETEKKRIAKVAADGTELGIAVGGMLRDGDILAVEDGKTYVVAVAPSHLVKVRVHSMREMGRLCFELGNRHLSLKIEDDAVSVPFDQPTFEYLKKLGFDAHEADEAFTGFVECKAHGASGHAHEHGHDHNHHHE